MKFTAISALLLGLAQAGGIVADITGDPSDFLKKPQIELKKFKDDTFYSGYI